MNQREELRNSRFGAKTLETLDSGISRFNPRPATKLDSKESSIEIKENEMLPI